MLSLFIFILLSAGPSDQGLNQFHSNIFREKLKRSREVTSSLGGSHKEIHSSVSKVGKTIDKVIKGTC